MRAIRFAELQRLYLISIELLVYVFLKTRVNYWLGDKSNRSVNREFTAK